MRSGAGRCRFTTEKFLSRRHCGEPMLCGWPDVALVRPHEDSRPSAALSRGGSLIGSANAAATLDRRRTGASRHMPAPMPIAARSSARSTSRPPIEPIPLTLGARRPSTALLIGNNKILAVTSPLCHNHSCCENLGWPANPTFPKSLLELGKRPRHTTENSTSTRPHPGLPGCG